MVSSRKRPRSAPSMIGTVATIGNAAYGMSRTGYGRMMRYQHQPSSQFRPYARPVVVTKTVPVKTVSRARAPAARGRARMRGNFKGKFKKPTTFRAGSFLKYGVSQTVESGAVSSNPNCVYVGHSLGNFTLLDIAMSSVIRRLFEKASHTIEAMTDKVQGEGSVHEISAGKIVWTYRKVAGGIREVVPLTIAVNSTYKDVVNQFTTSLFGFIGANDMAELLDIRYVAPRYLPPVVDDQISASIDLSMSKLHFMCSSAITVQNRTTAATVVGSADETSALDVANNPVAGKIYRGKGNGAVLRSGSNEGPVDGLIGDHKSGKIVFDLSDTNVSSELALLMKRPPTATLFNHVTKTAPCRLGPGVLKKDFIKFNQSINFNNFVMAMRTTLSNAAGDTVRMRFGQFSIFAFEKMCNTQDASEPDIAIGLEINQSYKCRITTGKRGITADHLVL